MGLYVDHEISSGRWEIRCPGEACRYNMSAVDVGRIATAEQYGVWKETRERDFVRRFLENDPDMLKQMRLDKTIKVRSDNT
jgi:hypothetical protein